MHWLSSPKVRLALIVNGLYFISLFTPTERYARCSSAGAGSAGWPSWPAAAWP